MRKKPQSRQALQSRVDFDRRDGRQMECEYFTSFRYFEPVIQSGTVTHDDSPDFLVEFSDRIVGVEITQLFRPESGRVIEGTQERILEEACRKAQDQNLPAAHVTLFFNLREPPDTAARRRIADAVVGVVAARMPPAGESVALEGVPGQPREVDLIAVNRVHCGPHGRWTWLEAGAIDGNAICVVQKAITQKSERLSSYLERCHECWLLLVADSFRTSGRLAFDDCCTSHVFMSPFARTYVLDFGKGQLHRLQTSRTHQ
jgi:hypothetical protein